MRKGLAVVETHPIQYHAPVYRFLHQAFGIPVTAIYGSDLSVAGYRDPEFETEFAWDTDLIAGYTTEFLSRAVAGGARTPAEVTTRGLPEVLRRIEPAAVLLGGYSPRFHQGSFWHVWRAGYPILFRGETTDHARPRGFLKRWGRDQYLRWLYRRCARLLYVGQRSLQHFERLGCPREELVFSPYCVATEPFRCAESDREVARPKIRREWGIPEEVPVLLFSGKLSPRKGPDLLLRAAQAVARDRGEKVCVAFLGEGALRGKLEALAKPMRGVEVRWVGFKNQTELSPYYHAADLLVLPSLHSETWGLVVNEALHHGLPCVVSLAVGCAPDLVEPGVTGELCETGAVSSLAEAIRRAATWMRREGVREQCRRKVSAYTVEEAAAGIKRAYVEVVRASHVR